MVTKFATFGNALNGRNFSAEDNALSLNGIRPTLQAPSAGADGGVLVSDTALLRELLMTN